MASPPKLCGQDWEIEPMDLSKQLLRPVLNQAGRQTPVRKRAELDATPDAEHLYPAGRLDGLLPLVYPLNGLARQAKRLL
ncbi:hypothetical protein [Deinococcus sp. QL22]|uniref:hypothetical protein n=1 Tax=Deinococcus sp. QL22 TaxID=2939437 RepID=UPI002017CB11|nr:hypothetical protein [Deinococcus sp. QL22]UQN09219.1 hypothetical protein M1R55_24630 [Deinococcus sp. QL22]